LDVTANTAFFCSSTHPLYTGINIFFFDVLLTVHLSIFILVINQHDAQNLFYNKFIFILPLCAHIYIL